MSGTETDVQPGAPLDVGGREEEEAAPENLGLWAITIVLAIIYVASGVPKLESLEFISARFEEVWGFPDWFRMAIGGMEFIGGILLIIPGTAFYAALMLSVIMLGATYTHLVLGNPVFTPIPVTCFVLLMIVAYARRPEWLRADHEA